MFKTIINRIFFMSLFMVSGLFAQGQTATGVGYGLTKDAAIEQAKRDAVEQGLGAYMTSTTTVTATSIEDNIYSKAQGFVKSFKVVKESKGPDGNFEITIEAQVTDMIDQVMADEAALQTLLNGMNRPRIIFLVKEDNLIDNTPTNFAETKLLSMFYEKGFDVVDRQLVQALKGEKDYSEALEFGTSKMGARPKSSGGHAVKHYSNNILEFEERYNSDIFWENPDAETVDKKGNPIGHMCKIAFKKSVNEKTGARVRYPIKYGRTNGNSIWLEKELIDMMALWGYFEKSGAWIKFSEDIYEKYKDIALPEKVQGQP